jgi:predicted peroxiredoxin
MFRQFAIGRFIICFIVFILAYMVASLSYDVFFHFLTAGMFLLTLWIMNEIRKGHLEELSKKDLEWSEKLNEMQEQLDQKQLEYDLLIQAISKLP